MLRIALGGFLHESHSFAPQPTGWTAFLTPGGFPPLQKPAGLIEALRPTALPTAGAIAHAEASGVELVPLIWTFANPAGPVTAEAFERIAALMVAALSEALERGPLNGLYLDLHGAMLAEGFPDAEAELLRRLRAVLGPAVPIVASLDPHANMTAAMIEQADILVPFRTYPHVDMKATGARAMALLLRLISEGRRPVKAFRTLDYLIPITAQCTLTPPMATIMAERDRLAAAPGLWELAFCFGFPYADFPGCGMAIAAFANTAPQAEAATAALAALLAEREEDFANIAVIPAEQAVARAIALAQAGSKGPIVLADTQDNPGGGGHGDTTGLLAELIRQGAQGAVLAALNDAEAAAQCHAAGEGAVLPLTLGGKSDGRPLQVEAVVERLADGNFTLSGPMGGGNPAALGPSALIRVAEGVRVIVVSRKIQAYDRAIFHFIGVVPEEQRILALKSSVHFRADFAPIAAEVMVVAAPGPVVVDPSLLPFRHLRPGLRLRPRCSTSRREA